LFESLSDLEANHPALFTRSVETAAQNSEVRRAAFFLEDHWRPAGLEVSYGLRAERVEYASAATPNPAVAAVFGSTPGEIPARWSVSPRLGFSAEVQMPWDRAEGAKTAIQGGIGEFVGPLSPTGVGSALSETGRDDVADLVCIGPAAPRPDWRAYRADPGTIPTTCADGSSPFGSQLPRATFFARDFGAPRAWRAALHGQGLLSNGVIWSLSFSWLRGAGQPMAFDRNVIQEPRFLNEGEGGRPIYASVGAIDPRTGAASLRASRRFPEFGTIREVTGGGRSRAVQTTVSATTFISMLRAELGYTWTDARETVAPLGGLGGSLGTTAGDPSRLDWAPAPYSPRHTVHLLAEWRQSNLVAFGLTGSISSGRPFTPMVAGDVNGDGVSNDRAFVFDPENPLVEERLQLGMENILTSGTGGVRDCLRAQTGRVAGHNSCWGRWSSLLDLNARFHVGPRIDGTSHKRLTIWVVARNVPAGLDYLLNGSAGLRGWGQDAVVDNTLLVVRGFDPVAHRFQYEVNPRFGTPGGEGAVYRSGFTLSIQGRVVLGSDRVLAQFRQAMAAAGRRDPALEAANLRAHLERQLVNLPAEVLSLNGPEQLGLLPSQARALQAAADSLSRQSQALISAFVEAIANPQLGPDAERIRELVQHAHVWRTAGVEITRSLLTPEQWARVPGSLRRPPSSFAPFPPQRLTSPQEF
jgi:hypothetical protein